jgi:hypothetical protein
MPATYEPIATTTLGSAASLINFTSISGSYTDLRLVYTIRSTISNDFMWITVNGAATNYSRTYLYGDGSSTGTSRSTNATFWGLGGGSGAYIPTAADTFALGTIDFFSYSGSTNKTALATWQADKNGSGGVERVVGLYRSTSAITSVKLETFNSAGGGGNFIAAGSTATLYGILKA